MNTLPGIGEVTTRLRELLTGVAGRVGLGTTVTTVRPESGTPATAPRINLYLYQVTPNAALRNADLQTRRSDGTFLQRPAVALDLHYLISFYGSGSGQEYEIHAQELLGETLLTLHQFPVLTRSGESPEVRVTPSTLTLEDLSKLWSVFFQTSYTLSVAIECSVLLLESTITPSQALPVQKAAIRGIPFSRAYIEEVLENDTRNAEITSDSEVVIIGTGLKGENVMARIGGEEIAPQSISDTEVVLDLSGANLQAGVLPVELVYRVEMTPGDSSSLRTFQTSNVVPLVLRPVLTLPAASVSIGTDVNLDLTITPDVGALQDGRVLLNSTTGSSSYVIEALSRTPADPPSGTLSFPMEGINPDDYLVRIQIDGAVSLLKTNAGGEYSEPKITIAL